MKTKIELIAKAMKAAKKITNGEHVVLKIGGKIYSSKALRGDAMPKQETWRERNLRRQAEGVRFQCVNPVAPKGEEGWLPPRKQNFIFQEEDYREYVPETKPKTKTIWFGLFRDRDNVVRFCADADQRSEKDLIERLAKEGFTPVGSIESREVGIES